jgi:hypothetical protein
MEAVAVAAATDRVVTEQAAQAVAERVEMMRETMLYPEPQTLAAAVAAMDSTMSPTRAAVES